MKILVTAASKHGATAEIAQELGKVLNDALQDHGPGSGEVVDVRPAERVTSVDDYDAVVLGSAVYAGHWLKPARELAEGHADVLAEKPVWLFSSGPVGDSPKPEEDPVDVAGIMETTGARGHRVFAGKLDKNTLGFAEKAVMMALRAPEGDFRDWKSVRQWAVDIADTIQTEVPA